MKGAAPHWRVLGVNVGDLSQDPVQKVSELPAPDQQQVVETGTVCVPSRCNRGASTPSGPACVADATG